MHAILEERMINSSWLQKLRPGLKYGAKYFQYDHELSGGRSLSDCDHASETTFCHSFLVFYEQAVNSGEKVEEKAVSSI
ncbi:uncharacterized protein LOC113003948 isoform X2 [Solenopsis invicta]|uniref:uncharacterized protein LOC113003948 isoform X2 n=1 Tax=Solenopsis invicta TaxID=13686 RepID=UPI00193EA6F4|nr:uncharacterized protein LOC113003948 isoform X2 [Solenopsis invicta]